jgi:hypothetical protein
VRISASTDGLRLAAIIFLLHLAGGPHYGFFRDELYFIVCGRYPAFGYVDQPPLVPLLAALSQLFGTSLVAIRVIPAIFAAAMAYIVSVLARDMGGGRFAGLLAVICATFAPILLAFGTLLSPDSTQIWLWPLAILFTGRAIVSSPTWWLAAGAAFGLAAVGKYSALIAAFALLLSLSLVDRRHFSSIRFWQGILIAAAILLPNALWQWQHNLPMLELLQNGQRGKNVVFSPTAFLFQQIILTNPILGPVWIAGLVWCFYHTSWHWLGAMTVALLAMMIVLHGKSYYPAPIYPALFAAGGVAIEHVLKQRHLARIAACLVCLAAGLAFAPLTMPVLPERHMIIYTRLLNGLGFGVPAMEKHKRALLGQTFADMHGWQALADQVQRIRAALPTSIRTHVRVFAHNYGEAAAIDALSHDPAMPRTLSGHNQYWFWGPGDYDGTARIDVGGNLEADKGLCDSASILGRFHAPYIMPYEDGIDIVLCLGLRESVGEFWSKSKHFD